MTQSRNLPWLKAFMRVLGPWALASASAGLLAQISGCATGRGVMNGAALQEAPILPGGSTYSWGWSQKPEDSANLERAQSGLRMYASGARQWINFSVNRTPATAMGALRAYYPMHVRWKLRDGREFVVDEIDTARLMRDHLRAHPLRLPWQREGRARDPVGDFDPLLAHEINDDEVRIKWIVILNRTPVGQRLGASGAANAWRLEYEEHLVAAIKGRQTRGIDFNNPESPGHSQTKLPL